MESIVQVPPHSERIVSRKRTYEDLDDDDYDDDDKGQMGFTGLTSKGLQRDL